MPNLKQRFSCGKIAGSPERAANNKTRLTSPYKISPKRISLLLANYGSVCHLILTFMRYPPPFFFGSRSSNVVRGKIPTPDQIKRLKLLACENISFSTLFASGNVSRGGTSATQRQKLHTDDVKSVRNPVRSADWSTE